MSSVERKQFRPVVDDAAQPLEPLVFTQDDVDYVPMTVLYERSCAALKTKPNAVVKAQLPTIARQHYKLTILDCSNTYLGDAGTAALVPVIVACIRLTHLFLPRVGMKAPAAKALLPALLTHPGITTVNLSHNELGTTIGKELLSMAIEHRRINTIELDETLIIQPIKRKIIAQLEQNAAIKESFSIPLIPVHPDDEDEVQKRRRAEEEAARAERERQVQKEMAERIPTWAPAALTEVSAMLHKYRETMEAVFATFDSKEVHSRWTTTKGFARAMRIMGMASFEADPELRAKEFADMFNAVSEAQVDFMTVIDALRQHATLSGASGPSAAVVLKERQSVDRLFDARETLRRSLEALDPDETRHVTAYELAVGVSALLSGNQDVAQSLVMAAFSDALKDPAGFEADSISLRVNYDDFVSRLVLAKPDAAPRDKWMVPRSEIVALTRSAVVESDDAAPTQQ